MPLCRVPLLSMHSTKQLLWIKHNNNDVSFITINSDQLNMQHSRMCTYRALNNDRSISLTRFSVVAVCVCSMVNVTYVWNGIAHLAGSLYIKSCQWATMNNKNHLQASKLDDAIDTLWVMSVPSAIDYPEKLPLHTYNNNSWLGALTRRLTPSTLRHFSTGSVCKHTSSYFLKWLRNVVLPAPMLPSMNTVNGAFFGVQNFCNSLLAIFCIIFPVSMTVQQQKVQNRYKIAQIRWKKNCLYNKRT